MNNTEEENNFDIKNEGAIVSLYKAVIRAWGIDKQQDMLIEEIGELLQAQNKLKRNKLNALENYIEEIADVEIVLKQIKIHFGIIKEVEVVKNKKINRLAARLHKFLQDNAAGVPMVYRNTQRGNYISRLERATDEKTKIKLCVSCLIGEHECTGFVFVNGGKDSIPCECSQCKAI